MKKIIILPLLLVILSLVSSCKVREVVVHDVVTDTTLIASYQKTIDELRQQQKSTDSIVQIRETHDSIYVHDSIVMTITDGVPTKEVWHMQEVWHAEQSELNRHHETEIRELRMHYEQLIDSINRAVTRDHEETTIEKEEHPIMSYWCAILMLAIILSIIILAIKK